MKPFIFFIFCSVLLYSSITGIASLKPNLRKNKTTLENSIDSALIKKEHDNKTLEPTTTPALIEKNSHLFDTAETNLSGTVNIREGTIDYDDLTEPFEEEENNHKRPRGNNLIQKKEKIMVNQKQFNQPIEADKKGIKYQRVFENGYSKSYNFNPVFEKMHNNHLEVPLRVKSLNKDHPIKHAIIPPTFGPVEVVKHLSATARTDINNQIDPPE